MRRLLIPAVLIAAAAVVYFLSQDSDRHTDRSAAKRAADLKRERAGEGGATDEGGVADAARVTALIRKYGGFTSKGSVALTLPKGPGVNLEVVFRTSLDGAIVEARAKTNSNGAFVFGPMPQADGYALTVDAQY